MPKENIKSTNHIGCGTICKIVQILPLSFMLSGKRRNQYLEKKTNPAGFFPNVRSFVSLLCSQLVMRCRRLYCAADIAWLLTH